MSRDYLNRDERNNFVAFNVIMDLAEELLKSSAFAKEDITNLKKALTWGTKFCQGAFKKLNKSAQKTVENSFKNTSVFVDDLYKLRLKEKQRNCQLDAADDSNEDYLNLVSSIFDKCCKNCKDCNYQQCDFYKNFEENMIPELDGAVQCGKCRYSFLDGDKNGKSKNKGNKN